VGWKLGLERIGALCGELGQPQRAFRSLHVVGTNGKTSVALIAAALLEASGVRSGSSISPHVGSWRERTQVAGREPAAPAFRAAVDQVRAGIERLREAGPADAPGSSADPVTQFEAAIAASFVVLREAGVEIAVIEAGLGGRLDATNVITSEATALTSVALDHTEWLGSAVPEIAAEKLAVLEPNTTLVIGRLDPEIERAAGEYATGLGARLVVAPPAPASAVPERYGPYLRRNAGVALELVAAVGASPEPGISRAALETLPLEGRLELLEGDPPVLLDAAHNEEGARALAEAAATLGRPRFACISVLADKDPAAIAAALAPELDGVVCTAADPGAGIGRPGAIALDPRQLAAEFTSRGVDADVVDDPARAIQSVLELARSRGGVAICAGSNYLLRHAWTVRRDRSSSR
jgi:dihydrofolate synthase/folylpolyglutamate synthase